MRISCVILQRRLPRRSVCEIGCWGELPVGSFFVIRSCWVARGNHPSGKLPLAIREQCNPRAASKPIAETYLKAAGRSRKMVVRKYQKRKAGNEEKEG